MKKISLFTIVLSIFALSFASSAFAVDPPIDIIPVPVAANLSYAEVSEFNLGETPYIYIDLPAAPDGWFVSTVETDWYLGADLMGEKNKTYRTDEYWLTLDSYDWYNESNVGTWDVDVLFKYMKYGSSTPLSSGSGSTPFTMSAVPEPISTVLFLLGGATLAARRLRKK